MIKGKQCTITWYVDDMKMSHVKQQVLKDLLTLLNKEFRKEAPLMVTQLPRTDSLLPRHDH